MNPGFEGVGDASAHDGSREPGSGIAPAVPAATISVISLAATFIPGLADAMLFRRGEIFRGQWWRLLTCHFVHLGATHLAMNLAALFMLAYVFRDALRPRIQALALLAGAATVSSGLLFAEKEVAYYGGLSGALHTLFFAGAVVWLNKRPMLGAISLAIATAKLALELGGRAVWLAGAAFPVVTAAHRWGAAGGLVLGFAVLLASGKRPRDDQRGEQNEA
jgi:rhomboid family GlyGly-CTERM serine protease